MVQQNIHSGWRWAQYSADHVHLSVRWKGFLMPFILLTILLHGGAPDIFAQPGKRAKAGQSAAFAKEYLLPASGYSQVVAVTGGGVKTLYISGQIGEGSDWETQMRSALANLRAALQAGGADYGDVVKMNWYIVDYHESMLPRFREIRKGILGDRDMPASTLVGVAKLGRAEWLFEVEAIAVLPIPTK